MNFTIPDTNPRGRSSLVLTIIILLLLSAAGYGGWVYFSGRSGTVQAPPFAIVQRGPIEDLVTATGMLQPRDYVDVGAQVSGQLHRIHVEVGSEVRNGDLLAEIDPTLLLTKVDASRAQLRFQRAQLEERESQLRLAQINYQRQKNLSAEQATTEEALQNAEAALDSARAQIEMLKAQIEQNESTLRADEANLGYAQIFAPMDGTVVSISARQGQTINASQQAPVILQIADLSTMSVQTRVSEADIARLSIGMDAYFTTLGGRERRWHGTLHRIEPTPSIENNVVLYNALFDVDNSERNLLPQMTAQVFFVIAAAQDALLVPVSALTLMPNRTEEREPGDAASGQSRGGRNASQGGDPKAVRATVVVLDERGQTQTQEVAVGISNRIQAQILSGLAEGDKVVTGSRATLDSAARQGSSGPLSRVPGGMRGR